jgi:hypothetical protein
MFTLILIALAVMALTSAIAMVLILLWAVFWMIRGCSHAV